MQTADTVLEAAGSFRPREQAVAAARAEFKKDVVPAKAGIHFDLALPTGQQNGFPLARE